MLTNTKLLLSADAACSVLLTVLLLPLVLLASFFGRLQGLFFALPIK